MLPVVTEPREIGDHVEHVVEGVWHWRIHNASIGGAISSSHAIDAGDGCVLVDPVRLADDALATLPPVEAVVLTATCHQRAAWRYRRELGVEVWLPEGARPGDEEPDRRYDSGDLLPGALRAVHTPGPEPRHHSFLWESDPGVLFASDLFANDEDGELHFIAAEYQDDFPETRRSVEKLLDLSFGVLCLAHGTPVLDDPHAAIRRLLAEG
jgi:hypothetical protein